MKTFAKAMDKSSAAFHYLKAKFPKASEAKLKEGMFIGPQIRSVLRDADFEALLNPIEKKPDRLSEIFVAISLAIIN